MDRKGNGAGGKIKLTEEQLAEVEKLAALFMEPREVALVLEVDEDKFSALVNKKGTDVYKKYWKGFLQSKTEVNESIINMAKKDSSPAQTLANSMIKDVERKLKTHE